MKTLIPIAIESESIDSWNVDVRIHTAKAEHSHAPIPQRAARRETRSSTWSLIIGARKSVFGMAISRIHADQIIHCLKVAGFSSNDLSALFPDNEITFGLGHEKSTPKHRTEQQPGVLARTAWWAARRAGFATIGALVIPEVGSFIAVGPIAAALNGGAVGGIADRLCGIGIAEIEAKRYEGKIKAGHVLISVHTENSEEIARAMGILIETEAREICATGEASMNNSLADERSPRPHEAASGPLDAAYSDPRP